MLDKLKDLPILIYDSSDRMFVNFPYKEGYTVTENINGIEASIKIGSVRLIVHHIADVVFNPKLIDHDEVFVIVGIKGPKHEIARVLGTLDESFMIGVSLDGYRMAVSVNDISAVEKILPFSTEIVSTTESDDMYKEQFVTFSLMCEDEENAKLEELIAEVASIDVDQNTEKVVHSKVSDLLKGKDDA